MSEYHTKRAAEIFNTIRYATIATVFASDNDHEDVKNSVEFLRASLSTAKFVNFHNYGHFCLGDMKTDAFPELLNETLA